MFAMSNSEYAEADAWLEQTGLLPLIAEGAAAYKSNPEMVLDTMLDKVVGKFLDAWQAEADLKTYQQAVATALAFRNSGGELFDITPEEWLARTKDFSWY